jgi:hypothetical protein
MKKTNVITIIAFVAIATGLFIYNSLIIEETKIVQEEPAVEEPVEIVDEPIEFELEEGHVLVEDLEAIQFSMSMTEEQVLHVIHAMSHQKVRAKEKWRFILNTPERVDKMIEIVEANDYKYKKRYLEILYRWQEGDFSRADKDHNFVWSIQGGTIGKATGLLSPQEEAEFIASQVAEPAIEETDETDTLE